MLNTKRLKGDHVEGDLIISKEITGNDKQNFIGITRPTNVNGRLKYGLR